jgi:hypothetical protein
VKASFTTTPLLIHANPSKPFVLGMDISNFTIGVVLPQLGENNLLHPFGFHFCKFSPVELNYEIHDKFFLTIMDAFEKWRHLLEGTQHEIIVYSNHKTL